MVKSKKKEAQVEKVNEVAIEKVYDSVSAVSVHSFCIPSHDNSKKHFDNIKNIFNYACTTTRKFGPFSTLPSTTSPDSVTLWEILQTRNKPIIRHLKKKSSKLAKSYTIDNGSDKNGKHENSDNYGNDDDDDDDDDNNNENNYEDDIDINDDDDGEGYEYNDVDDDNEQFNDDNDEQFNDDNDDGSNNYDDYDDDEEEEVAPPPKKKQEKIKDKSSNKQKKRSRKN